MTIEKDIKEAKAIIKSEQDDHGFTISALSERIARIRVEAALKAREEAWVRVSEAWLTTECWKDDLTLAVIRAAILKDATE